MYARKDIPTVLPDAVLRCRKLQTAVNLEIDEMEKTKCRRINNLQWQQQTFQKTLTERHKRWRVYDRAFRLKLKRELGADLATALRLRTIQDEEDKLLFEQQLIDNSLAYQKQGKDTDEETSPGTTPVEKKRVTMSVSAHPKSKENKASLRKKSQSAIGPRLRQSTANKANHPSSAVNETRQLSPHRPRTSRFHSQARRDTDPNLGLNSDFGAVLLRILSNIAATPDLDDDFTIRKRALEARERRLIRTQDDRYHNLVRQLAPRKISGEKDIDDIPIVEDL